MSGGPVSVQSERQVMWEDGICKEDAYVYRECGRLCVRMKYEADIRRMWVCAECNAESVRGYGEQELISMMCVCRVWHRLCVRMRCEADVRMTCVYAVCETGYLRGRGMRQMSGGRWVRQCLGEVVMRCTNQDDVCVQSVTQVTCEDEILKEDVCVQSEWQCLSEVMMRCTNQYDVCVQSVALVMCEDEKSGRCQKDVCVCSVWDRLCVRMMCDAYIRWTCECAVCENRLIREDEVYRDEDDCQRQRVLARNNLETYTFSVKQGAEEAAEGKLTAEEKKTVQERCSATLSWLDANTLAEKEEYEDKLKDLQKDVGPIMLKLHQGHQQGQGAAKGPTVEEVD
ncbi:hypothetical protein PR048_007353 [Dryococelus australis]|uniref:Uncharacterized protein n=1 Tax=Dryococelus australis TaxID=614101 RepID=A0ABQ9IDE3_9NEOP|nr:hypothetical protein PR048_007353 [Dryococelus australis]